MAGRRPGQRSERALRLAVAEMYVQGVSTRRVEEITKVLCDGMEISSSSVSRAAQLLDEELERWRNRPLGAIEYLILDARYEKVRHGGSVRDCALLQAVGIELVQCQGHRFATRLVQRGPGALPESAEIVAAEHAVFNMDSHYSTNHHSVAAVLPGARQLDLLMQNTLQMIS